MHGAQEAVSHRAVAGLLLKNALIQRTGPALTDGDAIAMNYVKSTVLLGLAEPEIMVRQTAGTVVMAILANEETGAWPEALDTLSKGMASQDENVVEVRLKRKDVVVHGDPPYANYLCRVFSTRSKRFPRTALSVST